MHDRAPALGAVVYAGMMARKAKHCTHTAVISADTGQAGRQDSAPAVVANVNGGQGVQPTPNAPYWPAGH
jgi:hypothetical protein